MTEPNDPIIWQPPDAAPPTGPAVAAPEVVATMAPMAPVAAEAPAFQARIGRGHALRAAVGVAAAITIVASVAVVVGTMPTSDPGLAAGASAPASGAARPSGAPGPHGGSAFNIRGLIGGFLGGGFGGPGTVAGPGLASITIASIDGTSVGLKTADGWTRTITVDSSVKVTEAGKAMTAADLKVGMTVRLGEKRNSDGTFTVTGLAIVVPSVTGQVTAKTATTITIKRFDGTSETIDVSSSTTFRIAGATNATLADVTVGMTIVAQGPQNSNGSIDALTVSGGKPSVMRPLPRPKSSAPPKPSAAPLASGTSG